MGCENKLRGKVFSMYRDIASLSKDAGWSRQKASRIVNGSQFPNPDDLDVLVDLLGISTAEEFSDIFFPEMSTKWTDKSTGAVN